MADSTPLAGQVALVTGASRGIGASIARELAQAGAKVVVNDEVLTRLAASERVWRRALGDEPVAGEFIGSSTWRRISEVWDPPDPDDLDAAIEIGARLAEYAQAIEPIRTSG